MSTNKDQAVTNVCCFGVHPVGVHSCCVMAYMCPGLNVAAVDLYPDRISVWNTKQIPSHEPGLDDILKKCLNRNLVFTTDTKGAVAAADIIVLSINSNSIASEENKVHDLTELEKAVRFIAKVAKTSKVIVEKISNVVGTNTALSSILEANKDENIEFEVVSNPEFFSEGSAIENLLHPDRVLIGSDRTASGFKAAEALATIYAQWVPSEKIITMSTWSAELTKLSVNAFLAQRLSSVHAMSMLCEATGADVTELMKIVGKCSEVGPKYLEPSLGFGGGHLKRDLSYLIYMCERDGLFEVADYWKEVLKMNEMHKRRFKKKILDSFFNTLSHRKIAIWGFAFKKDVQSATDSPAIYVCKNLLIEGAKLNIYDPRVERRQIIEELKNAGCPADWEKNVVICSDAYQASHKTHAIICCTDWEEFKNLNYISIYRDMIKPAYVFDGRRCLPHETLCKLGFIVSAVGKNLTQTQVK